MRILALVLALGLAGSARAQDATWYVGLPLAGVSLQAPDGSLPAADLEPLLRAKQGDIADPRLLATDLVTLFRVGEFAAVEVDAEPWFIQTETGELAPAAMVTYLAWAAPEATQVRPQTTGAVKPRKIRQAARIDLGSPFYAHLDGPRVEARVTSWLATHGYPEARVVVDAQDLGSGQTEVWVRVDEGPPRLVDRVGFSAEGLWAERREHLLQGSADLSPQQLDRWDEQQRQRWDRRLTRWAAKAGVVEGEPVSPDDLEAARFEIRRNLAALPPWWRRSSTLPDEGGWVQAAIHPPVVLPRPDGGQVITWKIEPGARLELDVSGVGWRGEAKAMEALGVDERLRLTRGWVEEAPDKLEDWMQERGFLEAEAQIDLHQDESKRVQTLDVRVHRGPRHDLRRFGGRYVFEGVSSLDPGDLRTVMDQASPEVLKRGRVTPEEVELALRAVEEFYRANGFLEAALVLDRLETRPYMSLPPLRIPLAQAREARSGLRRAVRVHVDVVEGQQSLLADFHIQGAAQEVDLSTLEALGQGMEGQFFSPQALERLARAAVDAHRKAGFLLADARVSSHRQEDGSYASAIAVSPGPQVLLRSVTVRGARRTRTKLVRGELAPHLILGRPLTILDLERSRRALYETGAFRSVHTDLLGEQDAGDLLVSVQERPRYSLQSGLGLATDQGFRGYARGTRNNWLGLAHRGELFVQLGFEWRSDLWYDLLPEWRLPEWRAAFTYTAPRFPTRRQEFALDLLFREIEQERTWRLARSGVGLSLQSTLPTRTQVRSMARLEGRQLEEVDPGALVPGEPWMALVDQSDPELPSPWRLQETLSLQLVQDLRDDPLQPRRGAVISLLGDYSPGLTGVAEARVPFVKAEARMSAWIPMGRGTSPILHLAGSGGRAWMPQGGVLALEGHPVGQGQPEALS